ncbi:MAG: peptidoglycan recognition family protein [Propioniciclava sp.]|uniref:peptidoglycan recognition protein family protein n=1 Tax=Propioniciclava sp. TaxID=2038686 RepID=UPI0039E5B500
MRYDYRRTDWGAQPAKGRTLLTWSRVRKIVIHWPASTTPIGANPEAIASYLRAWQRYHQAVQGWTDIAYAVGVDQAGRVWELRGADVRDGATAGQGGTSQSILAILGMAETPTPAMLTTLRRVAHELAGKAAKGCTIVGHGDAGSTRTDCPGPHLRAWVRAGLPAPTTTHTQPKEDDIMATKDELRTIIRDELTAAFAAAIPVSGRDPARTWTTTRDDALAAAAELERLTLADGTSIRTDDAIAAIYNHITKTTDAEEAAL